MLHRPPSFCGLVAAHVQLGFCVKNALDQRTEKKEPGLLESQVVVQTGQRRPGLLPAGVGKRRQKTHSSQMGQYTCTPRRAHVLLHRAQKSHCFRVFSFFALCACVTNFCSVPPLFTFNNLFRWLCHILSCLLLCFARKFFCYLSLALFAFYTVLSPALTYRRRGPH